MTRNALQSLAVVLLVGLVRVDIGIQIIIMGVTPKKQSLAKPLLYRAEKILLARSERSVYFKRRRIE